VGKPLVYGTSKSFMDYLGINSPDALPALRDIVSTDIVIPTEAIEARPEDAATPSSLTVTEDGELVDHNG
jgi:segregation and condensation protein B